MAKDNLPEENIRLGELKEGAGLEDSRINQDFVDFIRKWSTPLLMVAAAIAIGYFLYNKRIEARQAHIDEAFTVQPVRQHVLAFARCAPPHRRGLRRREGRESHGADRGGR